MAKPKALITRHTKGTRYPLEILGAQKSIYFTRVCRGKNEIRRLTLPRILVRRVVRSLKATHSPPQKLTRVEAFNKREKKRERNRDAHKLFLFHVLVDQLMLTQQFLQPVVVHVSWETQYADCASSPLRVG